MSQIVTTIKVHESIDLDSPRYIWSMLKDPKLSTSWRGKLPCIHHQPLIHSHHSKIHHKPGAEKWWCWENLETIDVGNEWKGGIATCTVTKQGKLWWDEWDHPWKFSIAPENVPSKKESSLPIINHHFSGVSCKTLGVYTWLETFCCNKIVYKSFLFYMQPGTLINHETLKFQSWNLLWKSPDILQTPSW